MRRNLTVVCVLTGLATAFFAAVTFVGFWFGVIVAGVLGAVMTLVGVWFFAGSILREQVYDRFEKKFAQKDFHGAVAVLEKASRNHLFFPLYRMVVYQLYLKAYLALDDTAAAAKYVDCLRHAGGEGWKYRTAFFVVLFNLDWEDFAAAHAEYEGFRKACEQSEIYREQIAILEALFARIAGEKATLPEGAKTSPYPIVHRIVEKY